MTIGSPKNTKKKGGKRKKKKEEKQRGWPPRCHPARPVQYALRSDLADICVLAGAIRWCARFAASDGGGGGGKAVSQPGCKWHHGAGRGRQFDRRGRRQRIAGVVSGLAGRVPVTMPVNSSHAWRRVGGADPGDRRADHGGARPGGIPPLLDRGAMTLASFSSVPRPPASANASTRVCQCTRVY